MRKISAIAALLALSTVPAVAQDFDWSGFYAGLLGGSAGGSGYAHANNYPFDYPTAALGGVSGGYDISTGPVVFGLTGDLSAAGLAWTQKPSPGTSATISVEAMATIRARIGIPVDRFMPYATAGAALGAGHLRGTGSFSEDVRAVHLGTAAGVGVEARVTSNLSVMAEYLAVHLGDADYAISVSATPSVIHHDLTLIRGGALWHF